MDWNNLLQEAVNETDASLASKISSLCHLTDADISSIVPSKVDKDNLVKVLTVVKDQTLSNEKKVQALQQIGNSLDLLIGIAAKIA
jgi:hypothetical protein